MWFLASKPEAMLMVEENLVALTTFHGFYNGGKKLLTAARNMVALTTL